MIFQSPKMLFFLLVLIVPIIIHLFNFRKYKKVYFSNVSFLKNLKTENEKKSKLKHLLILFSRILALGSLVFAFAMPTIPTREDKKIASDITIYIDNSFSSEATNEKGSLLNQEKEMAIELIENLDNGIKFSIITNDFLGKHSHVFSKAQAISEIKEIGVSPFSKNFSQITNRWKQLFETSDLYIMSDFQKNLNLDISQQLIGENEISLFPVQSSNNRNVYIDSVWFSSPNHFIKGNENLFILIKNESSDDAELRVELEINSALKGFANLEIEASGSQIAEFNYTNTSEKNQFGKISISDYENPELTFDDIFYFSYALQQKIDVTIINDLKSESKIIERVYRTDSSYSVNVQSSLSINYKALLKSNLIILNELSTISNGLINQLNEFVDKGGSILVIPNERIDLGSYQQFGFKKGSASASPLSQIDYSNPFFSGMFNEKSKKINLPKIGFSHNLELNNNILSFEKKTTFLGEISKNEGDIFVFSIPFSHAGNGFINHSLFVLVLLRIAELSSNKLPLYYLLDKRNSIPINIEENEKELSKVERLNTSETFIPKINTVGNSSRIELQNEITRNGNYMFVSPNVETPISFNYNTSESKQQFYSIPELNELISSSGNTNIKLFDLNKNSLKQIISSETGKSLWGYFIFAALLFFFVEILLIRLLK